MTNTWELLREQNLACFAAYYLIPYRMQARPHFPCFSKFQSGLFTKRSVTSSNVLYTSWTMRKILFFTFALLVLLPSVSQAAAIKPAAYRLSDTKALFIIPFEFQTGNQPFAVPMAATNGLPFDSDEDMVGFSSRQSGALVRSGYESVGMVLSTEDINLADAAYEQPEMTRSEYVLVAVLTFPAGMSQRSVGLQVTNIPYLRGEGLSAERRVVAEADLRNFRTNEVFLGMPFTLPGTSAAEPAMPAYLQK